MTEIKLYNTKTRKKEVLRPLDPENVRMYVCGPTVYDRAHIGNARPVIVFDTLFRLLRHVYGADHVTYARNFTDVDDKINARAAEMAEAGDARPKEEIIRELTDKTIRWYHEDMEALGTLRPTLEPRATEFIGKMVEMIEELVEKGHAYAADGHVLFDVNSYQHYGTLSGRSVKDMIAGARVEIAPYKRDPMDFVLWKPSSDELPGWDSPWGRGRPGWHIECSAMSRALFGEKFDIHGGGLDLQFPHHENEKAQSCAICGEDCFAQVWMHNEMLQVEGKKMSKSLGNFFSVRDLLAQGIPGEVIRFVYLSTHYRKPMDWTEEKSEEAKATLVKWYRQAAQALDSGKVHPEIINKLANDLNTHGAIAECHQLFLADDVSTLRASMRILGFMENVIPEWALETAVPEDVKRLIERLLRARKEARAAKDFTRSDSIRDAFAAAGVTIKDTPKGAEWELAPNFDPSKLEALK